MSRLVFLVLCLVPTIAHAQGQSSATPTSPAPDASVRVTSSDGSLLSASLVVGWHTETYRVRYEDRYGATTGYGLGHTNVADTVPVCTTPCIAELPSGPVRLSIHDGRGALFTETFVAPAGAELRLHVDRHGEIRGLGWMLFTFGMLGSIGGGATMLIDALIEGQREDGDALPPQHDLPLMAATIASGALWLLVALPLVSAGDGAHVEIIPGGVRF